MIPILIALITGREETYLSNAKQNTAYHQASEVLDQSGKSHNDAPGYNQDSDVGRRPFEFFEQNVARNFEQDVWDEEDAQDNVVLYSSKVQIDIHSFNFGIAFGDQLHSFYVRLSFSPMFALSI